MQIAFYAPLKPPDHPVASGDRTMARMLVAALEHAGHDVTLASHFRSYDGGDPKRQARVREEGRKLAHRYLRKLDKSGGPKPDLWFTYHLYHKAPDWLGPLVAGRLRIPYVVAEASYAPKQEGGPWQLGHEAVAEALRRADLVLQPNPADAECVLPLLAAPERLVPLTPFIDTAPFRLVERSGARATIAETFSLEPDVPWLLCVAMMREDQKLVSYQCLAEALTLVTEIEWRLLIVGAGPASEAVRTAFAPLGKRVRFAGSVPSDDLKQFYRAADLYVWPAIKEAFGMALIEAQAAGLPVIAGRSGGVPAVVADGETGLLPPEGDRAAFADAVGSLLEDTERRHAMSAAAMRRAETKHDIAVAAAFVDRHLKTLAPSS
jgi:glycosyltransferase involved in cell wall biosynthesis